MSYLLLPNFYDDHSYSFFDFDHLSFFYERFQQPDIVPNITKIHIAIAFILFEPGGLGEIHFFVQSFVQCSEYIIRRLISWLSCASDMRNHKVLHMMKQLAQIGFI
ncbi:hypothetical protein D3C77_502240 [compost metagenome]